MQRVDIERMLMNLIRGGLADSYTYRALFDLWREANPGARIPAWMPTPTTPAEETKTK